MTLLIMADDLTGAADSAARCHQAGLPAHIYVQPPHGQLPDGAVALSSDSRYLAPAAAADRVAALLAPFAQQPDLVWYKKIDSTLRGNIGAELDAMLRGLSRAEQPSCAIICPSFPAQGRGLAAGYLVYSQLPPRTVHLPTILAQQTDRPVALCALDQVRAGVEHLAAQLLAAQQRQAQLVVVDALTDADLDTLLAAVQIALPTALCCGSAGLIEKVAGALAVRQPVRGALPPPVLRRPLLALVGSGSEMAHRQLAALRTLPSVQVFAALPAPTAAAELAQPANHPGFSGWACHLPQPEPDAALEGAMARELAATLARLGVGLVDALRPQTLILVGGDTTVHMLEELGITQLTVQAELLPGIPLLSGVDAAGQSYTIVTKAGNFGDEQTLVRLFAESQAAH